MANKIIIGDLRGNKYFSMDKFKEMYHYKDLFLTFSWREFRVRYAQTFLGFAWAFLQPLATLFIFFFVFEKTIKIDTGNIPYLVFALTGLSAWSYFAFVVSNAGRSIINEGGMIKKIYFPRLVIPLSRALVGFIDFGISFFLLIIAMIYFGIPITSNILWLPVFIILIILASLGIGIWVSALTIRFRDVQHIIPFFIQIGLYASPVAYSSLMIPQKYHLAYYLLNPIAGILEGFRWCIIGGNINIQYVILDTLIIFLLFISSLIYFWKVEKVMADIL